MFDRLDKSFFVESPINTASGYLDTITKQTIPTPQGYQSRIDNAIKVLGTISTQLEASIGNQTTPVGFGLPNKREDTPKPIKSASIASEPLLLGLAGLGICYGIYKLFTKKK
jgi:hypothetical protein